VRRGQSRLSLDLAAMLKELKLDVGREAGPVLGGSAAQGVDLSFDLPGGGGGPGSSPGQSSQSDLRSPSRRAPWTDFS
jgi:hypothetical protein